jgi:O-antigen biosynthesis protein
MTIEQGDGQTLEWTGERYVPQIAGNIKLEHVHRYLLACTLAKGRRVLDIACGEGYGSDLLARDAVHVVGVDIAPDVVQHARRRYPRHNLAFAAGDCAAIPLADRSVDLVVSFETLEHHARHADMLREIRRVLRPGGFLVISSPDRRTYSDIPGYQNPFHVRELYREEFEALLAAQFRCARVYGQRVGGGSLVAPLEASERSPFVSFDAANRAHERAHGIKAPVYFIAIAGDDEVPELPSGVLDGGEFVWSEDHLQAMREAVEPHRAEIDRLSHANVSLEATTAALRSEIDRHVAMIAAMSAEKGREEERSRALQREWEERSRALQREWEERSHAFQRESEERNGVLQREIDSRGRRISELDAQTAAAHAALDALRAELAAREEEARGRALTEAELREALGRIDAARRGLEDHMRIIERSHSWKLTAPLRASRRLLARTTALARRIANRPPNTAPPESPAVDQPAIGAGHADPPPSSGRSIPESADVPEEKTESGPGTESPIAYVPLATIPGVDTAIKAIAFYLPQFHPIPENDEWWGPGFTEWQNVVRGRPQFPGHYQPHLPGELGFYDLRLIEVQRRQIELARTYGLHGFCYHHYWFGGTRLLRRPLDQLLANPDLDFPFCLCWANENWTRRWDGLEDELLIAQRHSPEDDLAFLRDIEPALRDPRYIRIDGRPLLVVYRPALLPGARATANRWREHCRSAGLPDLYLMSAQAFDRTDPREIGFDAALEFAPNNMDAPKITSLVPQRHPEFSGVIYDYVYLVERSRRYTPPDGYPIFRCVAPMWDNEARRPGRGAVFAGSTPERYREWLENACRYTLDHIRADAPLVFINAWNEWAEGAHLEPDRAHGYAYLQATADALGTFPAPRERPSIVVVSHDAYYHGAQRLALTLVQTLSRSLNWDVDVLLCGPGPLVAEFAKAGRVHDFFTPASTPESRERIVRQLHQAGARIALCNTSCVGETVELLKRAGFTVVSMIHELPGLIGEYRLEESIATIAREADRVVFAADVVRDRFAELTGMAPEKAVIRPQGVLAPNRFEGRREQARRELRTRLGLGDDTRIVLSVGFADRRKGIDLFVDVGLDVISRMERVVFVWVGHHDAGAFEAARERVVRAGAEDGFRFPGLVDGADLFFAGADAYLMTSREDPFPLVVLDALDAELPTIGFDGAGGFVELLRRDCGILVPYLDVRAMADALIRVMDDPAEGRRLAAEGKGIISREFSFSAYAQDLVRLATRPKPRISVIVPNYNYAHYLPGRLRSILTQSCPPDEIIFLDDCSTDRSAEVAERLLSRANIPFRIIRNESNQGVYRQWSRGLREATGELVWIAEADDECSPALLETLVPAFESSSIMLAFCQSRQIDDKGAEIAPDYQEWTADVHPTKWRHAYVRRGVDEIRDSLIVKNTIPNVSAVLMRKPDLSEIEPQLASLRNAGDWLLYVHLLERGDLAYFPDVANSHRRHAASVTIGKGGINLMREILLVQRHILARHPIAPDVERLREAHLQTTYEYLGLNVDGPASYRDHQGLSAPAALAG